MFGAKVKNKRVRRISRDMLKLGRICIKMWCVYTVQEPHQILLSPWYTFHLAKIFRSLCLFTFCYTAKRELYSYKKHFPAIYCNLIDLFAKIFNARLTWVCQANNLIVRLSKVH